MVKRQYTVTLKNGIVQEVIREEQENHSAIGLWRYILKIRSSEETVIEFTDCVILASEIAMISEGKEIND
ncbi:hypothetical protein 000TH008_89 [Bacillus phage 000TH008]|nr:hypothetical protein 000TH008_89 [Bacillus phage 000TH008]QQO40783.1 hypothetical protein 000TH009_89 [Bacillus phage 000TH009]